MENAAAGGGGAGSSVADELRKLGMKKGVLLRMAESGQLLALKCEVRVLRGRPPLVRRHARRRVDARRSRRPRTSCLPGSPPSSAILRSGSGCPRSSRSVRLVPADVRPPAGSIAARRSSIRPRCASPHAVPSVGPDRKRCSRRPARGRPSACCARSYSHELGGPTTATVVLGGIAQLTADTCSREAIGARRTASAQALISRTVVAARGLEADGCRGRRNDARWLLTATSG